MKNDKLFVLGVGAQKSGTTWVHSYLSEFPEASLGEMKEYHIWDGRTVPEMANFDQRKTGENALKKGLRNLAQAVGLHKPTLQVAMQSDPEVYFDYFAKLLDAPNVRITADITPSYTALTPEVLQTIKAGFDRRGIEVRVVFLMRDPVERCWSSVRMYKGMQQTELAMAQGVDISLSQEDAFFAYIKSDQSKLRTDYPKVLANIRQVFDEERIFLGCFETFFTEGEVTRLSQFLDLEPKLAQIKERVNASAKSESIPVDIRQKALDVLGPVYRYFEEHDVWVGEAWRR